MSRKCIGKKTEHMEKHLVSAQMSPLITATGTPIALLVRGVRWYFWHWQPSCGRVSRSGPSQQEFSLGDSVWLQWVGASAFTPRGSDLVLREWRITEPQKILSWRSPAPNHQSKASGLPQAQVLLTLWRRFSLIPTHCRDLTSPAAGRSLNACPRASQAVNPCVQRTLLSFGTCFLPGMAPAAHVAHTACSPFTASPWLIFLSGNDAWSRVLL